MNTEIREALAQTVMISEETLAVDLTDGRGFRGLGTEVPLSARNGG